MHEVPDAEPAERANQYRRVNDGIHCSGDGVFLCECLRPDCNALVELAPDEYEAVRADPSRFFVLPGHELPELEAVVERHERHLIVHRVGQSVADASGPA